MMASFIKTSHSYPRPLWRGFFAFVLLLASYTFSGPGVGMVLSKTGNRCNVAIYGVSIGALSSGKIVCQYASSVTIDDALIGTPIASVALGASINRTDRRLSIYVSATGNVNIDSASMALIQFPVEGIPDNSTIQLIEASFTDRQGNVLKADILPLTGVVFHHLRHNHADAGDGKNPGRHYLLNGRLINSHVLDRLEKRSALKGIPCRIVKQVHDK